MTPQEKAKELVNKFPLNGLYLKYGDAPKQYKEHSKQCALIVVDEVLKITNLMDGGFSFEKEIEYWQGVKQELEKL